ncbi:MAG TPA: V-type ATP synthase subunit E family protein [Methanomicrobiales archaeon]|nr:V-type ATP synthase subunit E family protein [Methanomicrobiales archaeon]
MELEAVAVDIREKAKREAGAIREETRGETEKVLSGAQERAAGIKLAAEDEANRQAARLTDLEVSSAGLSVKRMLLNTQKELLDQVYRATLEAIAKEPAGFRKDSVKSLLAKARKEIREGTVFCAAADAPVLKEILAGSEFAGLRFGGTMDIPGGVVIESANGELKIDYSYRTFLDRVWEAGLKDASDLLFP